MNKLDTIDETFDKLYWAGRADGSDYERGNSRSSDEKGAKDDAKAALSVIVAEALEYQVDTTVVADGAWDVPGEQDELLYISKDNVIRNLKAKGFTL